METFFIRNNKYFGRPIIAIDNINYSYIFLCNEDLKNYVCISYTGNNEDALPIAFESEDMANKFKQENASIIPNIESACNRYCNPNEICDKFILIYDPNSVDHVTDKSFIDVSTDVKKIINQFTEYSECYSNSEGMFKNTIDKITGYGYATSYEFLGNVVDTIYRLSVTFDQLLSILAKNMNDENKDMIAEQLPDLFKKN